MPDSVPHTSTPAPIQVERVHYFSNSDEGVHWQASRCDVCIHDINEDCEHVVNLLIGAPDPSLSRDTDGVWQCSSFSRVTSPPSLLPVALEMRDLLDRLAGDLPHGYDHNLCRSLVAKFDKEIDS